MESMMKISCEHVQLGYKLFRLRKDGTLGSLFINRSAIIPLGHWLPAEDHQTKGYAHRPGWHVMFNKEAPHLTKKGRIWARVAVTDYETIIRPDSQGGKWMLAQKMIVLETL